MEEDELQVFVTGPPPPSRSSRYPRTEQAKKDATARRVTVCRSFLSGRYPLKQFIFQAAKARASGGNAWLVPPPKDTQPTASGSGSGSGSTRPLDSTEPKDNASIWTFPIPTDALSIFHRSFTQFGEAVEQKLQAESAARKLEHDQLMKLVDTRLHMAIPKVGQVDKARGAKSNRKKSLKISSELANHPQRPFFRVSLLLAEV